MKSIVTLFFAATLLLSCGGLKGPNEKSAEADGKDLVVYMVDELYENVEDLAGKEVIVKGTVMHVCKQGGARCFLMGSSEDFNIRVEAGERIGAFSQEQMGSDLTISGIFREVVTAADAHNPNHDHGDDGDDHEHDEEAEEAHRIIAQAEEKAERIYFIQGLTIVKEED